MSKLEKGWRGLIKSLVYIVTPLLIFYAVCFVICTFSVDGVLWNHLVIPAKFYDLSVKVYNIGSVPMITTLIILLFNLARVAFDSSKKQEKQSLNIAVLEQKLDTSLRTQTVLLNTLNEVVKANVLMDDTTVNSINENITKSISIIEKQLSSTIDFDNLDVEELKKNLLTLKEISKSVQSFIGK